MKTAILGGGNMGASIAAGMISQGISNGTEITVSHLKSGMKLPETVNITRDNVSAIKGAGLIIVAVKPWLVEQVLKEIAPHLDPQHQAVASVAAGIDFDTLASWLQKPAPALFRIIPNTAVSIAKSVTFISDRGANAVQRQTVVSIFEALGSVYRIGEEQMPAATSLASCGIAYALRYMEAAIKGGVESGIDTDMARKIVIDTVQGALCLLTQHDTAPAQEIDKVTTPGGITLRGLEAMERSGFSRSVIDGLKASM